MKTKTARIKRERYCPMLEIRCRRQIERRANVASAVVELP
jgi:hypothetical protein